MRFLPLVFHKPYLVKVLSKTEIENKIYNDASVSHFFQNQKRTSNST